MEHSRFDHILFALDLDGAGAGQSLAPADIAPVLQSDRLGWVHLQADHPETPGWIAAHLAYLDETVTAALTAPETRPRATPIHDGLLVNLRGLNLNSGKDPEDMVAVRMWIDPRRIVTLSRQRVRALEDIAEALGRGTGPEDAGAFVAALADRLTARLEPFVTELDQAVDALEPQVVARPGSALRKRIATLRLAVIELRRHTAPQIVALRDLGATDLPLLGEMDHRRIAEAEDRQRRMVENVDELRDNLTVLRDEVSGEISDRLNRHMYILSIVSAIFLPLGFLTGLFGINLGGMPGAANPHAFWIFSGALVGALAVQVLLLRLLRWM
ncbi:zinc transporter ZntB [Pseudooceanicola aestuarii]|uniref:zinc transporter ZntB n=1 Tax=Pseudooceanicola aestuarii TaxID=2697319 RepID=UPI0013D6CF2B|nr:zinc transporter ZntB [Pseudooceanicola aestuarii]